MLSHVQSDIPNFWRELLPVDASRNPPLHRASPHYHPPRHPHERTPLPIPRKPVSKMTLASLISDIYESLTFTEVRAEEPAEEAPEQAEEEEEEEPEDVMPTLLEGTLVLE